MALYVPPIEGNLILSDADFRAMFIGKQLSFPKVRGSLIVYRSAWTAEQTAAYVAACVGDWTTEQIERVVAAATKREEA